MKFAGLLRAIAIAAVSAGVTMLAGPQDAAAEYPTKPIRIIIPYDAGGAADLQARIVASTAPEYIGQAVLASNRTGAAGVTGSNYVVRSKPDGYTLLLARVGSQAGVPAAWWWGASRTSSGSTALSSPVSRAATAPSA